MGIWSHVWGVVVHRFWVFMGLFGFCIELMYRALVHDVSKLLPSEAFLFAITNQKLKRTEYGSKAYKRLLAELGPALENHYGRNRHHPEHYCEGVAQMSLLDLVEMFYDWKASVRRAPGGNILRSIDVNRDRFGIGDKLASVLRNEAIRKGPQRLVKVPDEEDDGNERTTQIEIRKGEPEE